MSTVDRPLRRDAQRNRERILEAAGALFRERGLAVTLDDVAHRAGLGVGTVYRRFGSRDELIDALFEAQMAELVAVADEALAMDDAWAAFCFFITRMTERSACDRGLKEVLLGTAHGRQRVAAMKAQIRPRAEAIVERARETGALREDFDPSDLPLFQIMLGAIAEVAPPERPDLWRRPLELLLDAVRSDSAARLPLHEAPIGLEQLEDLMCRWRPPAGRPQA